MRQDARNADTVFAQAIEIASPQERAAFLENACANDPELRHEVESSLPITSGRASSWKGRLAHLVGTVDQPLTESPGSRHRAVQAPAEDSARAAWARSGWPSRTRRSNAASP